MGARASQITSLTIVLFNRLFRCRSNKTWKLRVTGLCAGCSQEISEFPTQMANNAENVSIWWRRHDIEAKLRVHVPVLPHHYNNVIMSAMASQITNITIVYSTVYPGADQRKHQSSASLAFVRGIHRWPVNSPHKWPVTRKMFPFDYVIMCCSYTKLL